MKTLVGLAIVVLLNFYSAVIRADNGKWYIGVSVGEVDKAGFDDITRTDLKRAMDEAGISPNLSPEIVSTSSFESDGDIEWKFYAGYRFNDYLGLEAMYTDLGTLNRSARLNGSAGLFTPPSLQEETSMEGYGLSLVGTYPFTSTFSVFAKVGAFNWETETEGSITVDTGGRFCFIILCAPIVEDGSYSMNDSGTDPMYGVGVEFAFDEWALRAEWERFTGLASSFDAEADMDLWTVGVQYHFGFGEH